MENEQEPVIQKRAAPPVAPTPPIVHPPAAAPLTATVPHVVGLTESAAKTAIENAGLKTGDVSTEGFTTVAKGSVAEQQPIAGTTVAKGSSVDTVISGGPPVAPKPIPELKKPLTKREEIEAKIVTAQKELEDAKQDVIDKGLAIDKLIFHLNNTPQDPAESGAK